MRSPPRNSLVSWRQSAPGDLIPLAHPIPLGAVDVDFAWEQSAVDRIAFEHGRPTYYETLLALAFLWFARSEVDVAVIEAGVGGTLDGTNVLRPQVAVITNVALDHTDILGDTVEDIARDKAGIAKAGIPLVSFVRDAGARARDRARVRRRGRAVRLRRGHRDDRAAARRALRPVVRADHARGPLRDLAAGAR